MRNNKGFTLVELLAMLVVLGILLGVAIPNIVGMVANQRMSIYKNDATNMVTLTKNQIAKLDATEKPSEGECLIYTLNYLKDYTSELEKGPNGQIYLPYESFVIYARKNNTYKYYIKLVEQSGTYGVGIALVDYDSLGNFDKSFVKNTSNYGFSADTSETINIINTSTLAEGVKNKCGSVKRYYK